MKIRFALTVDIDPAVWTSNYGIEGTPAIRADVQQYIGELILAQLDEVGALNR